MHYLTAILVAVGLLCCALSGCSMNSGGINVPTVSKSALQEDIAKRLADAGEKPESVTCKQDLAGEMGTTARCEVVVSANNSFEPTVTVTGIDGDAINYEMTPALSREQLEAAVSRLVSGSGAVHVTAASCESGIEGKVGAGTQCDVDAGGVRLRRTIEVSGVNGLMMNIDVLPLLTRTELEKSLLDELQEQAGQRPDGVTCSGSLEGKPGNTIDCTIVAGRDTRAVTLTVSSVDDSRINYNYEPKS